MVYRGLCLSSFIKMDNRHCTLILSDFQEKHNHYLSVTGKHQVNCRNFFLKGLLKHKHTQNIHWYKINPNRYVIRDAYFKVPLNWGPHFEIWRSFNKQVHHLSEGQLSAPRWNWLAKLPMAVERFSNSLAPGGQKQLYLNCTEICL